MTRTASGRRVAVIAGCRTPFCKAGTQLNHVVGVDLARHAVVSLLHRAELEGEAVDLVVMGQVVASPLYPNVAREVSLLPQFPATIPAFTVNEACASGVQAIAVAADQIHLGHADVAIAGGVESLSNVPILHSKAMSDHLIALSRAKTATSRLSILSRLRPRDLVPVTPAIAEPSTGESMGQSAEKMAKENQITREAQDRLAVRSHQRAHQGVADGRLQAEVAPLYLDGGAVIEDNGIRADSTLERLAALKPVFDRRYGSVTAGNASPLTDGAAAVLLMAEDRAEALGCEPLAWVRSYAVSAVDPGDQLLMGPVFAIPTALERAGIEWGDLNLIEMHEAFAAQVLSNIHGLEARYGWQMNEAILNVMGGSIAIGHPFGATGGRLVTTLANEMRRREAQFGLISVCAQGGLGFAMVLERNGR